MTELATELVDPELDDGPPPPRARSRQEAPAASPAPAQTSVGSLLPTPSAPPKVPIHEDTKHAQMHAQGAKSVATVFERIVEERRASVAVATPTRKLIAQAMVAIAEVEVAHRLDEAALYRQLGRGDAAGVLKTLAKREASR